MPYTVIYHHCCVGVSWMSGITCGLEETSLLQFQKCFFRSFGTVGQPR